MMKHALLAALGLLASAATPVCAQPTDELYAAAKKEGVVAFGGALKQKETEQILKDFPKRYPGVRVTAPMVQLIEGFIAKFDAALANDLLPGTFDTGGCRSRGPTHCAT